jgi:putative phosphoribosyl transferase
VGRALLRGVRESTVDIVVEGTTHIIQGTLALPAPARALVIFAHGSGSSRFSPRNRFVASALHEVGVATLLLDLLTGDEEAVDEITGHLRFDVDRLAARILRATEWAQDEGETAHLRVGYFGASTGAAAALVASVQRPAVRAVVSRGGRPDLAGEALGAVEAATLLLVGERDLGVRELNEAAFEQLRCPARQLRTIPGATHLFPEPGALDEVARHSADWFERHLVEAAPP